MLQMIFPSTGQLVNLIARATPKNVKKETKGMLEKLQKRVFFAGGFFQNHFLLENPFTEKLSEELSLPHTFLDRLLDLKVIGIQSYSDLACLFLVKHLGVFRSPFFNDGSAYSLDIQTRLDKINIYILLPSTGQNE